MQINNTDPSVVLPSNDDATQASTRGKPFEKRNSYGKGRPKGSKNKKTLLLQEMLLDAGDEIVTNVIDRAVAGDPVALALCVERLIPALKDVAELPIERSTEPTPGIRVTFENEDGTEYNPGSGFSDRKQTAESEGTMKAAQPDQEEEMDLGECA
jgi:hypothetical protein